LYEALRLIVGCEERAQPIPEGCLDSLRVDGRWTGQQGVKERLDFLAFLRTEGLDHGGDVPLAGEVGE
jgi:hypothetical protein